MAHHFQPPMIQLVELVSLPPLWDSLGIQQLQHFLFLCPSQSLLSLLAQIKCAPCTGACMWDFGLLWAKIALNVFV